MAKRDLLVKIAVEMNARYFERREEITGLLIALIARQNIFLLGPPGTGKSDMTNDLCTRIQTAGYFYTLLNRTSPPEQLVGPVSLKALENDEYINKIDGYLPTATIGFGDEIWKCNSAVLNILLPILNERTFKNGIDRIKVPLQMFVGASNEMPEDREELGALWDRFLLRYNVQYIKDKKNFKALMLQDDEPTSNRTTIDMNYIIEAQEAADKVDISKIMQHIDAIKDKLKDKSITVSDRRWKGIRKLIKAHAWLFGRSQATDEDLQILMHALWDDPKQANEIKQIILETSNPLDTKAQDIYDQALEIYENAIKLPSDHPDTSSKGAEANSKFKKLIKDMNALRDEAIGKGKNADLIIELLNKIIEMNREVLEKCLGIRM